MAEAEKTEVTEFNPELIKVETIEEAKKKIFELYQDINKTKEKFTAKENEFTSKIESFESKLAEIENEKAEAKRLKEESEKSDLEGKGKYKELYEQMENRLKELEKNLGDKTTKLSEYEKQEQKMLEKIKVQRKALIEKIPEEDRETYKEASLEILEKIVKFYDKNPVSSQTQLPTNQVPPQDERLLVTERINDSPEKQFARAIHGKYK